MSLYYALRLTEDVGILVKKCMVVEGGVENMDVVLVMNVVENVDVIVGVKDQSGCLTCCRGC